MFKYSIVFDSFKNHCQLYAILIGRSLGNNSLKNLYFILEISRKVVKELIKFVPLVFVVEVMGDGSVIIFSLGVLLFSNIIAAVVTVEAILVDKIVLFVVF